ncbi:hypothetical protein L3Y34_013440 [Caenorhabditis briggsae]|uniref:Uncharacterized protein n=1 Tax=Caenorhabditis briggsae TaxID=6238 RepID=A0AAE9CWN8_CAEBR|nr:hypothetical protein L3Y34_013440 [Caenorhabditis briggsae]
MDRCLKWILLMTAFTMALGHPCLHKLSVKEGRLGIRRGFVRSPSRSFDTALFFFTLSILLISYAIDGHPNRRYRPLLRVLMAIHYLLIAFLCQRLNSVDIYSELALI